MRAPIRGSVWASSVRGGCGAGGRCQTRVSEDLQGVAARAEMTEDGCAPRLAADTCVMDRKRAYRIVLPTNGSHIGRSHGPEATSALAGNDDSTVASFARIQERTRRLSASIHSLRVATDALPSRRQLMGGTTPSFPSRRGYGLVGERRYIIHTQEMQSARGWTGFSKRGMWACRDEWKGGVVT